MSAEITYNGTLTNAALSTSFSKGAQTIDQTTKRKVSNVQAIGFAAHEALVLGEVATCRWAYFENKDLTNYVEIGVDVAGAFVPFIRLAPATFTTPSYVIVPLATNAPYAKANTASVDLLYEIHAA
jgi:hypothetical protein